MDNSVRGGKITLSDSEIAIACAIGLTVAQVANLNHERANSERVANDLTSAARGTDVRSRYIGGHIWRFG
jgi:hypothetical protein